MNDDLEKLEGLEDMDDLEAQLSALGILGGEDASDADPLAGLGLDLPDTGDASDADPFADLGLDLPDTGDASDADPFADLDLSGIGSDDADDPFASLGLDLDDDDPFASLGGVSAPAPVSTGGGDLDLDRQLEMLLNADKVADDNWEERDVFASMPTKSVYDPEVDGMGTVSYVKGAFVKEEDRKTKLFENISGGRMIATLVVGILLIALGAVSVVLANFAVREQRSYAAELSHFSPVALPRDVVNNANFVYMYEAIEVGGQRLTLVRVSVGHSGTIFYFEENFNPDDFYIMLFDQARNLYARTSFGINTPSDTGTVLVFDTLSLNTLFLVLHVQCKETHEYARFHYRFTSPPVFDAPVFITRPLTVMGEGNDASGLMVRHATFDNTSTKIHFSFTPNLRGAGLRVNPREYAETPFVIVNDFYTAVNPLTYEDSIVFFDEFNMYLGAATFGPVFTLEGNVEILFNDLTYFYPNPEIHVLPTDLFGNDQTRPLPVQTGAFTLNLEGMIQHGSTISLTLHGVDESGRRRATNLDITLRAITEEGYVDMPGIVRVHPDGYGTDVHFDMAPHGALLRDVYISQYSLVVAWVEYDVPQASVPIRVSPFFNMPGARRYAAEAAVYEAFIGLLAHKSGEISPEGIVGLSPQIHNSEVISGIFAPVETSQRPMFAATVSAGDMVSNYDFAGIVDVVWVAGEGEDIAYFSETFKVTARSNESIWSVVSILKK
ncbi:MAG: hypothetical protein FWF79_03910 [Defluviitaleaceae bacterium]|nr:hypothetical protein [Defluviitaleaceae bacterium]